MEIKERKIKGVYEILLSPHMDDRGFFMRTFDVQLFTQAGLNRVWVQENHSRSEKKGIIRGLHLQLPPFSETKLVRCTTGAVLDVFVDLRKGSETFGKWDSLEISADNKKMIYIPRGFAHGFCTLTDISEVLYKVDNYYNKEYEVGILWNDPLLGIEWPLKKVMVSEKDAGNMKIAEFIEKYNSIAI